MGPTSHSRRSKALCHQIQNIHCEPSPISFPSEVYTCPSQILTFDEKGISLHPNHISIPFGLRRLLSTQLPHPIPKLYTLISLPPFAKFQGPVAPVLAKYDLVLQHVWYSIYAYLFGTPSEVNPDDQISVPVFVSGAQEYLTALKSMYQHRSQLVWFRWLYVAASRYMWVNEWLEVKIPSSVTGV